MQHWLDEHICLINKEITTKRTHLNCFRTSRNSTCVAGKKTKPIKKKYTQRACDGIKVVKMARLRSRFNSFPRYAFLSLHRNRFGRCCRPCNLRPFWQSFIQNSDSLRSLRTRFSWLGGDRSTVGVFWKKSPQPVFWRQTSLTLQGNNIYHQQKRKIVKSAGW